MSSILDIFSLRCLRDMQVVKQIKMNAWHSTDPSSGSYCQSHKDIKVIACPEVVVWGKGEKERAQNPRGTPSFRAVLLKLGSARASPGGTGRVPSTHRLTQSGWDVP